MRKANNLRKIASAAHGINSKYFNRDAEIRQAITSLLWIAQGNPENATIPYTKAKSLVAPLANLGVKDGWSNNGPKELIAKATEKAAPKTAKRTTKATKKNAAEKAQAAADAPIPTAPVDVPTLQQQVAQLSKDVATLAALMASKASN